MISDRERFLVIDSSAAHCKAAICSDGSIVRRELKVERQAAQRLLPLIKELLEISSIKLNELNGIAVMSGPGSFTGLRIGVGVAQGLSFANSLPVVAVSNLAARAKTALTDNDFTYAVVCEEARKGEVYFAIYKSNEKSGVVLVGSEQLRTPSNLEIPEVFKQSRSKFCVTGNGWHSIEQLLSTSRDCPIAEIASVDTEDTIEALCLLAALKFRNDEAVSPELLQVNYVKESMDYS